MFDSQCVTTEIIFNHPAFRKHKIIIHNSVNNIYKNPSETVSACLNVSLYSNDEINEVI